MALFICADEDNLRLVRRIAPAGLCECGGEVKCLISREDMEVWRCEKCFRRYDTKQYLALDKHPTAKPKKVHVLGIPD